jgi:hypothetical protein
MNIIAPDPRKFLLPEGTRRMQFLPPASSSLEPPSDAVADLRYETLPALMTPDGRVVAQWKPDANDLAMLNNGAPVTLIVYTGGRLLSPVSLMVGGTDLR